MDPLGGFHLLAGVDLVFGHAVQRYGYGTVYALPGLFGGLQIDPHVLHLHLDHARRRAYDEDVVPGVERLRFDMDLGHADLVEPVRDLSGVDLFPGRGTAVDVAPFPEPGSLVITVPEAPVEDFAQFLFQFRGQIRGVPPVADARR